MSVPASRERGMTSAEYAVGTVGVVAAVGVGVAVMADPMYALKVIWPLVEAVIRWLLRMIGAAS